VAERYSAVRRYLVGERHREISEKHGRLALFAITQGHNLSLPVRMAAWNQQYPEWAYTRESNFSRDMLQAQRRLLGTTLDEIGAQRAGQAARKPSATGTGGKRGAPRAGKARSDYVGDSATGRRASAPKRETRAK
jgi:hypothetical protein